MSNSAPRKWTEAQRAGIETVGKSLLVSAAAGSGKTTVLAERCVHLICDENSNCTVDQLLVVTFTEAAAAEMKSRIASALRKRHATNPSAHLTRQLALIDRAAVGTLHGFCSRLLRQHFHLLGLDPSFIILDQDETTLLKTDVVRDLFADRYDTEDGSESFRSLVDHYGDGRDERLAEQVISAHDTLCSVTDPALWMMTGRQRIVDAIELPMTDSFLGQEYHRLVARSLESIRTRCEDAEKRINDFNQFPTYVAHLRELYSIITHWIDVLKNHGVDALVEEVNSLEKLPILPRVTGQPANKDSAKAIVDDVKDAMKSGSWRQLATFTETEWKEGLTRILPHVEAFLDLVKEFGERYSAAKNEEGGLDFSDLERFTLRALCEPGTLNPSPLARAYHRQFRHVLVDEYQDINEVQDAILSLISRECVAKRAGVIPNLFCVGDVKQSIYRFRLAEAGRFLARSTEYSQDNSHGQLIALQNNYRSRGLLLEAINGVFERLMTADAADLTYDESQRLTAGLEFPNSPESNCFPGAPIELHLLPKEVTIEETSDEEEADRTQREAKFLARRVLELTGNFGKPAMQVIDRSSGEPIARKIRFGDIVILLRSMKFKADVFAEELRSSGVPVHSESSTGYFQATEINDILSLLQVLDNQHRDIPLASVLRSPLAGLPTADDDLARIRLAYPSDDAPIPFQEAVVKYSKEQNDDLAARLRDFLNQLAQWRQLARQRPLAELLWTIYSQTGYLTFVSGLPNGEQRQANLIELHERAQQFGTFRRQGLNRFLQFLEKLKSDSDLGQAELASEAEDVVRIMSIHRSKGLEFPVVLLPDLGKAINMQDCQGSILLDRFAGIGFQVVDAERYIRYPSLASVVVQQRLRQQTLAEELRVLYVAMTRAKEHLILVGTCRESQLEKWNSAWSSHTGAFPAEAVLGARSMLDWIGPVAAAMNGAGLNKFAVTEHSADEVGKWNSTDYRISGLTIEQKQLADLLPLTSAIEKSSTAEETIARLGFQYPFAEYSAVRAVDSVTARSKSDSNVAFGQSSFKQSDLDRVLARPAFLAGITEPTAADRGTATHVVLEHFDFSRAADVRSINAQIAALVDAHKLSADQKKMVDVSTIQWFLSDEIGSLIQKHAGNLTRELSVYFAISSDAVTGNSSDDPMDQVMIRGRLDLLIETAEGLVIVDYKNRQRFRRAGGSTDGDVYRTAAFVSRCG